MCALHLNRKHKMHHLCANFPKSRERLQYKSCGTTLVSENKLLSPSITACLISCNITWPPKGTLIISRNVNSTQEQVIYLLRVPHIRSKYIVAMAVLHFKLKRVVLIGNDMLQATALPSYNVFVLIKDTPIQIFLSSY